jgi:hypothetical protein
MMAFKGRAMKTKGGEAKWTKTMQELYHSAAYRTKKAR